jgi:C-terminal domain 12 of the ABC-three component (ABC-3C) systems
MFTISEAPEFLGVSEVTLRRWGRRRKIQGSPAPNERPRALPAGGCREAEATERARAAVMKYVYEDLGPDQFEDLVVAVCQFLLGAAVQGFATGPDGGRDAKFVGTAELHPSKTEPWKGTTIIQAKHTNGYNKTFSDADFFSEKTESTVLGEEFPRVKKLRAAGQLDHYMLFSNRRLSGNAESKLRKHVAAVVGIPELSVYLCGVEQLELWLKRFPEAARIADVDPVDSPLIVSPDDLAEVVEHLASQLSTIPDPTSTPVARVPYERKNELNNMSKAFALSLRRLYLKESQQIKAFLAAPENSELLARYEEAAEEFQLQVLAKRKDHQRFDEIFVYLIKLLLGRDPVLRAHKRLTRATVFYMYWNCDLGVEDA